MVRVGTLSSSDTDTKVENVYSSIQSFANFCAESIEVTNIPGPGNFSYHVLDKEEGELMVTMST